MFKTICYAIVIFGAIAALLQTYENATTAYFLQGDPESNMVASRWLYHENLTAHPVRPFLYPTLIGLPFLWTNTEGEFAGGFTVAQVYFGVALNFLAWLFTVGLLFKILRLWQVSEKRARLFCLIFAANVGTVFNNFQLLTEAVFTALFLAHIYCSTLFFLKKQVKHALLAITFVSVSALTRPTLFPIAAFLMPLVLVLGWYYNQISLRQIMVALCLIGSILGVQIGLMKRTFGTAHFSYIRQWTYCFFSGAYAAHFWESSSIEGKKQLWLIEYQRRSSLFPQMTMNSRTGWQQMDSFTNADLKHLVIHQPSAFAATLLRNFLSNATASTPDLGGLQNFRQRNGFDWILKIAAWLSRFQNIFYTNCLVIAPFLMFFNRRLLRIQLSKTELWASFYSWLLAFYIITASSISFTQGDRFHIVIVPITLILLAISTSRGMWGGILSKK
jgi:hypothetical protein